MAAASAVTAAGIARTASTIMFFYVLSHTYLLFVLQVVPGDAAAAADVAATAAQLRQWVDTSADKEYLLLHARVEAAAGRCAAIADGDVFLVVQGPLQLLVQ